MPDTLLIERIELTYFEVAIENMTSDAAGFGIAYAPGRSDPQIRFAVKIFADSGVVGEYVPGRGRARVIATACEALAHSLIGKPALQRERHYRAMRGLTNHIGCTLRKRLSGKIENCQFGCAKCGLTISLYIRQQ